MSRKQRAVFRIEEAAEHLGVVLDILKKSVKADQSITGVDMDGAAAGLVLLKEAVEREAADHSAVYPTTAWKQLDTVFTQILQMEKQVVWPEGSPEGKTVAAHLLAASDAIEITEKPGTLDE